ncbi:unnamed protein product (macronuclear) [Paramecium tetraurelia]|uniref:Uncharacterized protein n=1 Tax=Paramecium tetraurelia TaxID=5888 RepID=A0CDY9_PARTE|nr:uncharacterized protein GSPATT00007218001 [Paramecium tetraurelia]CAK69006.1 unnamed protein product [Paramecium tetraurelia]|eukprot:XP_001436403.1 hypothetical protein (macronuclear) [Paramecium tetraurelia strain d4-2]
MIQSEYPLCPKHQNPIRFIDIQENVPKIQRTLCDECYLNNPLSIHQAFDYLCQQQNTPFQQETTFEKCKEEYLVMKNKVVENLKLAFAQIEMEIEKEMDSQKTLINDSVFQYYLGKQTTLLLEDYQQLGELLSVQLEKKGENLIQKQNEKNSQIQFAKQLQKNINILREISLNIHKIIPYVKVNQKMEVLTPNDLLVKLDGQFIVKQQLDNLENIKCIDYHRQLQTLIYGCYKFQMDQNEMVIIRFDKNFNVFLKEEYTSHSRTVNCIKSSLISNFCITGSEDSTVKVWKIVQEGLCCEQTLEGHQDSIICICLNRVESILASGSSDNHIIVWYLNVQNKWQKAQTIVDSPRITLCINFNRLSELMVTGCIDHSIYVWSVVNEKWRGSQQSMNAICFINQTRFASASWDSAIKVWDRQNTNQHYAQVFLTVTHYGPIVNLILIEESNHLISCAYDTTVIWSIDPQDLIVKKQKITAAKGICQINEQKLSIITYENQLKIYSLEQ